MVNSFVTDWPVSARLPCYTRANAGEVLADPASPLGWTLVFEQGLLRGWRQGFIDFGVYRESELDEHRPPLVGMFGGYFYLNLSHMRLMAIRMGSSPDALDAAYLGRREDVPPYRPHPEDECAERSAATATNLGWALTAESFPEIDADRERALAARDARPDLSTVNDAALVARMRSFLPELATAFHQHDYTALASTVGPAVLGELLAGIGRPELLLELLSGWGEVDSAEPSFALWDLGRKLTGSAETSVALRESALAAEFSSFLRRFGCRGPNEWDIAAPSWEARPELAVALLDRLRHAPEEASPYQRQERLRQRRLAATEQVRAALRADAEALGRFEIALRSASVFIPARERTKTTAVTLINEIRLAALELGRRGAAAGHLREAGQIMMLLASEVDDFLVNPGAFTELLAKREREYRALFELEPPFIIADRVPPLTEWPRRRDAQEQAEVGAVLTGAPGAPGTYQGRVRIVRDLADPSALRPGEVMVAPLLDAAWTPLLMVAGAVVADVGATNSHAAVVCRELGIPCVLSATGASAVLRDGMLVRVDGATGVVTVDDITGPERPAATPGPAEPPGRPARAARLSPADRHLALPRYEAFLPVNLRLREVCTRWQCRADGSPNDHTDPAYDERVLSELSGVHTAITPILRELAEILPSAPGFLARLDTALDKLLSGDRDFFASPCVDSYHTVWMWLHEELLQALDISRAEDADREQRHRVRFVTGLAAAPGAAPGQVAFTSADALRLAEAGHPVVLVAESTTPADLPGLLAATAVLTSDGGFSSHAAVVARGAGIPAVCGARGLRVDPVAGTAEANGVLLRTGDLITLDGATGEVYLGAVELRSPARTEDRAAPVDRPGAIAVRVNADTAAQARTGLRHGATGIGLCRTEHQFLGDRLPLIRRVLTEADPAALTELSTAQQKDFLELLDEAGTAPVTVRLLDAPTHEFLTADQARAAGLREANPMLGVRGIRMALRHDQLYPAQTRALFRAWAEIATNGPAPALEVLVPLVSLPEELDWAATRIQQVAEEVARETGVTVPYRLGCMIETPRAALLAGRLAATAEFLSFGTNDLTQLTYGFSRDDVERLALDTYQREGLLHHSPFARLDPDGVGALLEIAVGQARAERPGIGLGLCGEHAADPDSIAWCARLGLDHVSCAPALVPQARRAAR